MATMSAAQRAVVWGELQGFMSRSTDPCKLLKADILAAVNALDDFFSANAAAINNALPAAAKANLSTAQKARLLMFVIERRYLGGL